MQGPKETLVQVRAPSSGSGGPPEAAVCVRRLLQWGLGAASHVIRRGRNWGEGCPAMIPLLQKPLRGRGCLLSEGAACVLPG